MWQNYLKVALRSLRRHPGYSAINVAGLAVGLACCLVTYLFVRHELSYDRFHAHAERIVRVSMTWIFDETELPVATSTTRPGPWLAETLPEVVEYVRFRRPRSAIVTADDERFLEEEVAYADSALFEVFTFPLLRGDPERALARPNTLVLTERLAETYFDDADPVGRTVLLDGAPFEVTGVMADVPPNSHIQFGIVASFTSLPEAQVADWNSSSYYTYLLLTDAAAVGRVRDALPGLLREEFGEGTPNTPRLHVTPLTEVYLHSDQNAEWSPEGDIGRVYAFSAIALLVLLIACINYLNLATARAVDRAREVGVRKALGAQRRVLIAQFMGEAMLVTGIGVALALGLTFATLPFFESLSGRTLSPEGVDLPLLTLGVWLVVGLLAGSYPAMVLSRFQPVGVLKGRLSTSAGGVQLRKGLVVIQFAISIILIIGTLVIDRQVHFIESKELGYDKEHVVVLPVDDALRPHVITLKQAMAVHSSVRRVALSSHLPIDGVSVETFNAGTREDERQLVNTMQVDPDFVDLMGLRVLAGSPFTEADMPEADAASQKCSVLLNESAARHFGWAPAEAAGKVLRHWRGTCTVRGVVADFHFASLHDPIEPLALVAGSEAYHLLVRTASGDPGVVLADLRRTWEQLVPDHPFIHRFLDQEYDAVYHSEQQAGRLFRVLTLLALFVACLGLLGLTAFSVVQRTKEIGVRKVLGASVPGLVGLISKDFIVLVLVGFALAAPLAHIAASQWLDGFAYRIELGLGVFLLAGGLALLLALATVSTQALRAATADPVEALRYE